MLRRWFFLPLGAGLALQAPEASDSRNYLEVAMSRAAVVQRAVGTFTVRLSPLAPYNDAPESRLGRLSIDKEFAGDLVATSKGEMLNAMTAVDGSAGYVAIERVSGTLQGRSGTFVLQHNGIMDRGNPSLTVVVVPDSGTGELAGITGAMTIEVEGGTHSYVLEYTLP